MSALLLLCVCSWQVIAEEGERAFELSLRLARSGLLVEALEAADLEENELARAQARVFALYKGRDYLSALAAARAGLEVDPDDVWLLDRATACLLALGDGPAALEFAQHLAQASAHAAPPRQGAEESSSMESAVSYSESAKHLIELERRAGAALRRARSTALALLALSAAALLILAARNPSARAQVHAR